MSTLKGSYLPYHTNTNTLYVNPCQKPLEFYVDHFVVILHKLREWNHRLHSIKVFV